MTINSERGSHRAAAESRCENFDDSDIRHFGWSRDIGMVILPCSVGCSLHRTWYWWMAVACWLVSLPVLLLGMLILL